MAKTHVEERIIGAVGGRFKLATLIEKRQRELLFGGRPLVPVESTDPLDVILEEVVEKKIELIPEAEALSAARAALMAETSNEAAEEQAVRAALEVESKAKDEDEKPAEVVEEEDEDEEEE